MNSRTHMLRTAVAVALCFALTGCGCGSDGFALIPPVTAPSVESVTLEPGSTMPPCPVTSNPQGGVRPIDVLFVLDDGTTMVNAPLGLIPDNQGRDARSRTLAAQAIMRNFRENVPAEVQARFPGEALDFAFGVGRFEDYGGTFAGAQRNHPTDDVARPWVLQMPILRQAHPAFLPNFNDAIARTTPGGGERIVGGGQVFEDPNSGIEALYQAATGAGFSGSGAATTLGSGAPCGLPTQLTPGPSGDVPAVTFTGGAAGDATDPDGRPVYFVRDEGGNVTQIPDLLNPGQVTNCIASGNLGGVGWREGAARFIIICSDIATIAPFNGPVVGTDTVQSTPGTTASANTPAIAPRDARLVPADAFNNATGRWGPLAGNPQIAPTGAATVENAIAALNELHIEVLCLAAPTARLNQAKPNGGFDGTLTDIRPILPGEGLGELGDPTITPWTWLSAVSMLTGSEILYQSQTLADTLFPAVYNLATVWPIDPAATQGAPDNGSDESNILDHLREDFVQRLAGPAGTTLPNPLPAPPTGDYWIPGGYLTPIGVGGQTITAGDLPLVTVPVTLTPKQDPGFLANFADGGTLVPQTMDVTVSDLRPRSGRPRRDAHQLRALRAPSD